MVRIKKRGSDKDTKQSDEDKVMKIKKKIK